MPNPALPTRILPILVVGVIAMPTQAAETNVYQEIYGGNLQIEAQPTAELSPITLEAVRDQLSSGSLGRIIADDSRGNGAGWSVTATTSNFTSIGNPVRISGTAGALQASGRYGGGSDGTYTVQIVESGPLGTAQYIVNGPQSRGAATITSNPTPLVTNGVLLNFAEADYQAGDEWTISLSSLPAGRLSIEPSTTEHIVGSITDVTAGQPHTFIDESDSATIMVAETGYGLGRYANTPELFLSVPSDARSGSYTATITETIN